MERHQFSLRSLVFIAVRATTACVCSYIAARMLLQYLDPTHEQRKSARLQAARLLSELGVRHTKELCDYEMQMAAQLVTTDQTDISWADIGGYDDLLMELQETIILPLKLRSASSYLQAPKGVLLHGPPGCGKTLIARAIAKHSGARFINLDISSLTDKWYGESQKLVSALFSLAQKIQPVIIFIDEIDSFLRSRESRDHEATAMMKAQFLSNWDGFASNPQCQVVIVGASNRPMDVDPAILRRMPARFYLSLPDQSQRTKILRVLLRGEQLEPNVDLEAIASRCDNFSCSDLRELCRLTAVMRLRQELDSGVDASAVGTLPFGMSNFDAALNRMSRDCGFQRWIGMQRAEKLSHVMYRVGILAALRAKQTGATVGVMVTASHNPIEDNGVKVIDPSGAMLADEWEKAAERLVNSPDKNFHAEVEALIKEYGVNMNEEGVVCCGRDTRPSSRSLAGIVEAGVQAVGGELINYDLTTTPQLHYIVRESNLHGRPWRDDEYFHRMALAFDRLNTDDRHFSPLYDPRIYIDCANGVAARKMGTLVTDLKVCLDILLVNRAADKHLNEKCGAEFVKVAKKPPVAYEITQDILPNRRWASFDGDADRVVYFYLDDHETFHLLDGDKIAALVANYLKALLDRTELDLRLGVVQTAYANGNATRYLRDELRIPVICTQTGVKHLHAAAKTLDIGIYFEPNGHGTVLFSDKALADMWRILESRPHVDAKIFRATTTLYLLSQMVNQAVGDAIADVLLVETILRSKRWPINRWDQLYADVPNKLIKFKVADRKLLRTADCERSVVYPAGLQERINDALKQYGSSRAVVRPSGTEDVVRVYTEADTQEHASQLAIDIQKLVTKAVEAALKNQSVDSSTD